MLDKQPSYIFLAISHVISSFRKNTSLIHTVFSCDTSFVRLVWFFAEHWKVLFMWNLFWSCLINMELWVDVKVGFSRLLTDQKSRPNVSVSHCSHDVQASIDNRTRGSFTMQWATRWKAAQKIWGDYWGVNVHHQWDKAKYFIPANVQFKLRVA